LGTPTRKKEHIVKRICALALLTAGVFSLIGCACCGDKDSSQDNTPTVRMTSSLKYEPAKLTVRTGQTVHWKNVSIMSHTVTADPSIAKNPADVSLPAGAEPFTSGMIRPGKSYDHVFTVPGTYRYFCIPHETSGMVGTVIVEPAGTTATP
jgi:plastocyanin